MILRAVALAVCLAAGLAGQAVAAPAGESKNFNTPGAVPDYFSNESGPFRGQASRTYEPPAADALPEEPRPAVATARHRHAVASTHRGGRNHRLARGHVRGGRHVAQARGGRRALAAAHGHSARGRAVAAAHGGRTPARGRHSGHGRG